MFYRGVFDSRVRFKADKSTNEFRYRHGRIYVLSWIAIGLLELCLENKVREPEFYTFPRDDTKAFLRFSKDNIRDVAKVLYADTGPFDAWTKKQALKGMFTQ